ncbi:MAG: TonB family protein [Terracidiphilus sp.]
MDTEAIRSDWVGRVIDGRFTLLQWIGGSGGGGVFLTELQGHGSQKAAIKLISADARDAEANMAGWAATTTLSHPHLMRLFHTGRGQIDSARLLYAVTEYAEEVLSQILPERPLTPSEAREMLDPVLDALSYLHGKGLVHGHVKPSNIMVVDNQVKLSVDSLHVGGELGKHFPALNIYDAPEGATETISPAADVWSLGVTLVEALTQHPPVWDRSTQREPIVPESIPQPFAGIAQECLRSDPTRRCTLSDVKARLEPARSLPAPASKTGRAVLAKLRVTALIAAALVLFAGIAALLMRSRQTRPSLPTEIRRPVPAIASLPPQSPVPGPQTSEGAAVKGAVAEQVLPDVLPSARESIRGQVNVTIRVTVDPGGDVSNATFDSPGASKYFANLALQAARSWKFKPAQVDGQAVSSVWILRFQFRQTATEVTPVEASP